MIETITKHQFENALPKNLWTIRYDSYTDSFIYKISVHNTNSCIYIDSTIGSSNYCNKSDSKAIKIWSPSLSFSDVLPSHLKRTLGWNHRLIIYLRYSYLAVLTHYNFTYDRNERLHRMADYIIKRRYRKEC